MAVDIDALQKMLIADKEELSKKIAEKIGALVENAADGLEEASDNAKEALGDFEKSVEDLKTTLKDCEKVVGSIDAMNLNAEKLSKISDKLSADIEENSRYAKIGRASCRERV